jgi:hypothetical protein
MKIKKGTLVLLLKQGMFGPKFHPETPLGQCIGLVLSKGQYDFGEGFEVDTLTGDKRYVCKKDYLVALAQVDPGLRKGGIRYLLERYHHLIISRFVFGVLNIGSKGKIVFDITSEF